MFLDTIKTVEVKAGDKYVKLDDYYRKNWESSKLMWVKCFRNSLPLLGDNTSNRVESSFAILKRSIADTFVTVPKTVKAIKHLVEFADERLKDRYLAVTNRVLKIYHPDEKIRSLNEEASKHLNDLGCKTFFKSLCRFEEKRNNMELVAGGVKEIFSNDEEKNYTTTSSSCNCTFFANYQAPCSHMIYIRRLDNMYDSSKSIFNKAIFDIRYHRNESLINVFSCMESNPHESINQDDEDLLMQVDTVEAPVSEEEHDVPAVMNDRQKFKMVMPLLVRIANIASVFGTNQFLEYFEDLQNVERKMRKGVKIYSLAEKDNNKEIDNDGDSGGSVDANNNEDGDEPTDQGNLEELDDTVPQEDSQDSQTSLDSGSKFRALVFKESIKTRGRPKKKSKQVTFNKTALDRKQNKRVASSRKVKPKLKTSKKDDFIDDEVSNSEDEESGAGDEKDGETDVSDEKDESHEMDVEDESDDSDVEDEQEKSSGDDSSPDFDNEVAFSESTKKPNCDKCKKDIVNYIDLTYCTHCMYTIHVKCLKNGGCRTCIEEEF